MTRAARHVFLPMFLIRYEDVEIDTDLAKETGRKDIVFFPANDEDIYFCLEAKRLNALVSIVRKSLADEYVREGMQRFVDGKYARFVRHGGMLGYVLDGQIARAAKNVEANVRRRAKELRMTRMVKISEPVSLPAVVHLT